MSRVLVTGAGGFIGSHCLTPLVEREFEVHAVSSGAVPFEVDGVVWHRCDLLDDAARGALVSSVEPTHLLHLAWFVVPGKLIAAPENFDWVRASLELVRGFADTAAGVRSRGSGYEYDWRYGYCTEGLTPSRPTRSTAPASTRSASSWPSMPAEPDCRALGPGLLPLRPEGAPRAAGLVGDSLAPRGEPARCSHGARSATTCMSGRGRRPGGGAGLGGSGCGQRELGATHDAAGDRARPSDGSLGGPSWSSSARSRPAPTTSRWWSGRTPRRPCAGLAAAVRSRVGAAADHRVVARTGREAERLVSEICVLGTGMAGFGAAHTACGRPAARPCCSTSEPHYGGHTASFSLRGQVHLRRGAARLVHQGRADPQRSWPSRRRASTRCCNTKVNNHWKGHWIKHPAQVNLYGLPTELVIKIIADFVAGASSSQPREIRNYEDWLRASFGNTFAETFPMEYTIKYHTTDGRQHEHRLDRAAPLPGEPGGDAPRARSRRLRRTSTTSRASATRRTAGSSRTSGGSWTTPNIRLDHEVVVDRPEAPRDPVRQRAASLSTRA